MNPERSQESDKGPIFESETDSTYTIETVAELAGVSVKTVLHYQELGVIRTSAQQQEFDTETLWQLRRIEQLRHTHALGDSGVKLIAELLGEIEGLRHRLRQMTR
jgi:DNA-binding transcriptional MerR regulator